MIKHYYDTCFSFTEQVKNKEKYDTIFPEKTSAKRPGCKDVFHAFLVKDAVYDGFLEIPRILPVDASPKKLIVFSKAIKSEDHDAWIHFYEDDAAFERIWNNPRKYLPVIKRFEGVISPDFSLYRDMPLVMQLWNIYRSRALASWFQNNNIPVITNVRFGDERSYGPCCIGVPANSIIAIGTHGCIKLKRERKYLIDGLEYVVKTLAPKEIIVYGAAPDSVFEKYRQAGIKILQFDSDYMVAHRKAGEK